jgi:hypothetical protein
LSQQAIPSKHLQISAAQYQCGKWLTGMRCVHCQMAIEKLQFGKTDQNVKSGIVKIINKSNTITSIVQTLSDKEWWRLSGTPQEHESMCNKWFNEIG